MGKNQPSKLAKVAALITLVVISFLLPLTAQAAPPLPAVSQPLPLPAFKLHDPTFRDSVLRVSKLPVLPTPTPALSRPALLLPSLSSPSLSLLGASIKEEKSQTLAEKIPASNSSIPKSSVSQNPIPNSSTIDSFPVERFPIGSFVAERFSLDNGIVVYFARDDELPILRVTATIDGGAKDDAIGKEGTARLLFSLLRAGGSVKYAAEPLDERLDFLATTITASAAERTATVSLAALQENTDESLEIFAALLLNPALPNNKLEVLRGIALEEVRRLPDDQQALVFQRFNRLLHAATPLYRYATERSLKAVTRDDLLSLHQKLLTPGRMFIAASGALSAKAMREKLNNILGKWGSLGNPKAQKTKSIPNKPHDEIYFIVKDSPQSIIVQGWLAPPRASADSFPTEIINDILGGGGLVSRLFSEVRTKQGYAYATGSFYRQGNDFGVLGAYSFVQTQATLPALMLMSDIITDLYQGNFTLTEIARTKNAIRNRFVFLFDSPLTAAQRLLELEYLELPRDFHERYLERVEAVENTALQALAHGIFQASERLTIIIGPHEQLEKLRAIRPDIRVME